jgi:hypothetical protein
VCLCVNTHRANRTRCSRLQRRVFCHTYRSLDHANHYEDKCSSFIPGKYHYFSAQSPSTLTHLSRLGTNSNSIAVKPGSCLTTCTNSHFLFLITVESATSQMLSQQPTGPPPLVLRAYEKFSNSVQLLLTILRSHSIITVQLRKQAVNFDTQTELHHKLHHETKSPVSSLHINLSPLRHLLLLLTLPEVISYLKT